MKDEIDERMACYKTGRLWERGEIVKWLRSLQAGDDPDITSAWGAIEVQRTLLADAIERGEHER